MLLTLIVGDTSQPESFPRYFAKTKDILAVVAKASGVQHTCNPEIVVALQSLIRAGIVPVDAVTLIHYPSGQEVVIDGKGELTDYWPDELFDHRFRLLFCMDEMKD